MNSKINSVLLIDDDSPTNFLHKIILEDLDCVNQIETAESAKQALGILHSLIPDIIFLDLNMPAMTGWNFIEKFKELIPFATKKPIIYILTTSENPDDLKRAKNIKEIAGYKTKPLTEEIVFEIMKKHFSAK
jgi:CheY-like chemotaxis protein